MLGVNPSVFKVMEFLSNNIDVAATFPTLEPFKFYILCETGSALYWKHAFVGYKMSDTYGLFISLDYIETQPLVLYIWRNTSQPTVKSVALQ